MTNAFEIVLIAVAVVGILLSFTRYLRPGRAVADLGRVGSMWFEHIEDREVNERPSEDARETPIPRRPLRSRY